MRWEALGTGQWLRNRHWQRQRERRRLVGGQEQKLGCGRDKELYLPHDYRGCLRSQLISIYFTPFGQKLGTLEPLRPMVREVPGGRREPALFCVAASDAPPHTTGVASAQLCCSGLCSQVADVIVQGIASRGEGHINRVCFQNLPSFTTARPSGVLGGRGPPACSWLRGGGLPSLSHGRSVCPEPWWKRWWQWPAAQQEVTMEVPQGAP